MPPSGWPSSAPACRGSSPRTACARPASSTWSSRRTTTSAARGSRTPIRGAGSTTPTTTTATRSRRRTTGRSTSPTQRVLLDYFRDCADELGLRDAHPLRHRGARRPRCDDATATWAVDVRDGRRHRGDARRAARSSAPSASSTGRKIPDDRRARRRSRAWRSTPRGWDHDRRPAAASGSRVIGTGASAVQFIPEIAGDRRPAAPCSSARRNWLGPDPRLPRRACPRACAGCTPTCPSYGEWYRFWTVLAHGRGLLPAGRRRSRVGAAGHGSVSVLNEVVRELLAAVHRASSSPTVPTCSPRSLPQYPPGAKRMHPRQRGVGRRPEARRRHAGRRIRSSDHRRPASSPPTASSTTST